MEKFSELSWSWQTTKVPIYLRGKLKGESQGGMRTYAASTHAGVLPSPSANEIFHPVSPTLPCTSLSSLYPNACRFFLSVRIPVPDRLLCKTSTPDGHPHIVHHH